MTFGYVKNRLDLENKKLEIEVEKIRYACIVEKKPLHDPENKIIKN